MVGALRIFFQSHNQSRNIKELLQDNQNI